MTQRSLYIYWLVVAAVALSSAVAVAAVLGVGWPITSFPAGVAWGLYLSAVYVWLFGD